MAGRCPQPLFKYFSQITHGKAEIGNNYERPSDKTLNLIRVETLDNELIALLINYAVHGVFLNGNFVDDKLCISGDIPGQTSAMLEEKLGGGSHFGHPVQQETRTRG